MILPLSKQDSLAASRKDESADVDVLRETLLAIGRIPMLTGDEEERLARAISVAKKRFRRTMLHYPEVLKGVADLLDGVSEGRERLDRVLDVTLSDLKGKSRLRAVASMHARTLRTIAESVGSHTEDDRILSDPMARKAQQLADEALMRTSRMEGFLLESGRLDTEDANLASPTNAERRVSGSAGRRLGGQGSSVKFTTAQAAGRRYWRARERYESLRNRMVAANLRLAVSIAKKYQHSGVPLLDLIQEGSEGLIRAAEKFQPELGFKFSTYSVWWIQQRIRAAVSEKSRLIRIGEAASNRIKRLRADAVKEQSESGNQGISFEDLSLPDATPTRREELRKSFYACRDVLSLDLPLHSNSQLTHADTLPSQTDDLDSGLVQAEQQAVIGQALRGLTKRECQVLRLRFGLEDGNERNLAEVGRILEISRERVRQIEQISLQKLRSRMDVGQLN